MYRFCIYLQNIILLKTLLTVDEYIWLQVQKVPVTPMEAMKSNLMGIFEKRRAGKFFGYVQDYDEKEPKTHNGMDLTKLNYN